jgi:hypothetical protein
MTSDNLSNGDITFGSSDTLAGAVQPIPPPDIGVEWATPQTFVNLEELLTEFSQFLPTTQEWGYAAPIGLLHDKGFMNNVRAQIKGPKLIGMFDLLADGGAVDMDTLFDALNSTPGIYEPRAKLMRLRAYAERLNDFIQKYGLFVNYSDTPGMFQLKSTLPVEDWL